MMNLSRIIYLAKVDLCKMNKTQWGDLMMEEKRNADGFRHLRKENIYDYSSSIAAFLFRTAASLSMVSSSNFAERS